MLEVKSNYKGDYRGTNLFCEGCKSSIETQYHVLFCPYFSDLRQDIDLSCDKDLVNYDGEVMKVTDKLKKGNKRYRNIVPSFTAWSKKTALCKLLWW